MRIYLKSLLPWMMDHFGYPQYVKAHERSSVPSKSGSIRSIALSNFECWNP